MPRAKSNCMVTYRREMQVGAMIALAMLTPLSLVAQGGGAGGAQQRRVPVAVASVAAGPAAGTSSSIALQLAGDLVKTLAGTWRFEVRFAGNFTGAPDASGTRVFEPLFGDLRLQWRETLDSSSITAQGVMGFDPDNNRFYSTAVYSSASGVELLTGTLDLAEPFVAFRPAVPATDGATRSGTDAFTLRLIDQDHFTWSPIDRSWRAVFTRR